jgi:phosphoribosylformimino-5-aminoimidazole carboxamide ribotide isomerase
MIILPAIDLYEGSAVRLYKGDYNEMTVYDRNPSDTAAKFTAAGAEWIHVVDLEGARDGGTPNMHVVSDIISKTGAKVEIGGGIRNMDTIAKYMAAGASRIVLGTSAITNEQLVVEAVRRYGDKIAVGADIRDGYVSIRGWTEKSDMTLLDFCDRMQAKEVRTLICTDVSKDGALQGTNRELYRELNEKYSDYGMRIIASGGVSSIDDIRELKKMNMYGAIIGRAYYEGAIDLAEAIEEAK